MLRPGLEATGLVQAETVAGVNPPYLRFHPTLAPAVWGRLAPEAQAELTARFRDYHYELAGFLYQQDDTAVHATRAIARRVLPNLLAAVRGALVAGAPYAVDFVNSVNRFLNVFGLTRERAALVEQVEARTGEPGSREWYLTRSNQGEALYDAGRLAEAVAVFEDVLAGLGETPSYERCVTLHRLGRCYEAQRRTAQAEATLRQALTEAEQLEPSDQVKREVGYLQADLADTLTDKGDYVGARAAYEAALVIAEAQDDRRQAGVVQGQLGTLALVQNDLAEAERRYQAALVTFQQLGEPAMEAVAWHQLGRVYQEARQWTLAERAYRESARLKEAQGNTVGAARSWDQLAQVMKGAGQPVEAEAWYRKALAVWREAGDPGSLSITLGNLANLLQNQPERLDEARMLAEEALAIDKTLDPAAAEIWKTFNILAKIAAKAGDAAAAADYRRQARAAQAGFAGTRHQLRKYGALIAAVVQTVNQPQHRPELDAALEGMIEGGWDNLVGAIRRVLDGERDEEALCEPLDAENSLIINAILAGIENPRTLDDLLAPEPDTDGA